MAQKLRLLNPDGRFIVLSWNALAVEKVNPETIVYPGDFFYDPAKHIIRRPDTLLGHFKVSEERDL